MNKNEEEEREKWGEDDEAAQRSHWPFFFFVLAFSILLFEGFFQDSYLLTFKACLWDSFGGRWKGGGFLRFFSSVWSLETARRLLSDWRGLSRILGHFYGFSRLVHAPRRPLSPIPADLGCCCCCNCCWFWINGKILVDSQGFSRILEDSLRFECKCQATR